MKKYLFLVLIVLFFVSPFLVQASILEGPLVQCGTTKNPNPCTLCDIFKLVQTIINFISVGLFILAPIFIVVGGLMILLAGAKPSNLETGKSIIKNAIIGVIIALLAWVVINTLFNTLVSEDKSKFPGPWNTIQCTGGGINEGEYGYQDSSYRCYKQSQCPNPSDCVACTSDCIDGTDCTSTGQWCKRTAPSGSDKWKLTSYVQNPDGQRGDASQKLTSLLNCMYGDSLMSNLQINAISSNVICNNSSCDTTKGSCGHSANSCHFGGQSETCKGYSYAVDFNFDANDVNTRCSVIRNAAKKCDSIAWVYWESDHTHVSVNGQSCGCDLGPDPNNCPN
jgi:hypothetical protein